MSIIKPGKQRHPGLRGGLLFTKATAPAIREYSCPTTVNIKIVQHQGLAGNLIVKTGDHVLKGQPLTESDQLSCVPVHASSAGIITAISEACITIQTSQDDKSFKTLTSHRQPLTREQLVQRLHQHGIVGLGGAGFPTAQKIALLNNRATTLLINAAECDPLIHCDDALMSQNAGNIFAGIKIITKFCEVNRVLIGIEDNKPTAIKSITNANIKTGLNAEIITVPSVYPSGAEKLLLELCGQHSSSPDPLARQGILCVNVATCFAIYNAVTHGVPLISRVTTVTDTAGNIHNFDMPIGTPVADIYKTVHNTNFLPDENSVDILIGGKMMGKPSRFTDSTDKSTNCIAFTHPLKSNTQPTACIRCGACADICPEQLLPQQLYTYALNFNAASLAQYQLPRCIECGCCDIVCPSHLPLARYFSEAKRRVAKQEHATQQAEIAKQRFEKRERRLAASSDLQPRRSVDQQTHKSSLNTSPDSIAPADSKKALIEAALKRKKDRNRSNNHNGDQSNQP